MLELEQILKSDRLMRATTGLNRQPFEALLSTDTSESFIVRLI